MENQGSIATGLELYDCIYALECIIYRRVQIFLEKFGIKKDGYQYLAYIGSHGGCRVSDLMDYMDAERATVHRRLNMLGKLGLLKKKHSLEDPRAFVLHLTHPGRLLIVQIENSIRQWDEDVRGQMGEEEYNHFCSAVRRIVRLSAAGTDFGFPTPMHKGIHDIL